MKMKVLVVILVFLIIVNLATLGSYIYFRFVNHPMGPPLWEGGPPPGFHPNDPMAELTQEQRTKVISLLRDYEDQTKGQRERIVSLEDDIFKLLDTNPVQQENVAAALKAIADTRFEISRIAVQKLIETKSFLSKKQQRDFYNTIFANRMDHPGPPMSPGGLHRDLGHNCDNDSMANRTHNFEGKRPQPPHN